MSRASFLLLVVLVWPLGGAPLANAQADGRPPLAPADSARLLATARRDQAAFERLRRNRLTETWGGGSSRCDERIGRFCLRHGARGTPWEAPPEHPQIVESRRTLIEGLGMAAALVPGDSWIVGQRVRYLVEARRFGEAVEAARDCRAERSWCAALAGFAHHYAAEPARADSAFAVAMTTMAEDERRRWAELTLILDDRSARIYRRLAGTDREAFERRYWRLANPFFTRPGNELRSEHFARHVWNQLQFRAQSADGISWGWDLREILLRYGWPSGWERTRGWGVTTGQMPLVSHYSSAPSNLLPPPEALLDEPGTGGEWQAEERRSRTGYAIPLADSVARWFSPVDHQLAVFRRGDSVVIVAAYELPSDSVGAEARVEAGLGLLPLAAPEPEPQVVHAAGSGPTGRMIGTAIAGPMVVSLEIAVPEERRLARVRYGLDPPLLREAELAASDILLLQDADLHPDSAEHAFANARGSTRISAGETIVVYWEIYGAHPDRIPVLTYSLRIMEGRVGWLRRVAERAGLLREAAPIRIRWQEATLAASHTPRALTIDVPEISPGLYTLELTVEAVDREPLVVRRDVEIMAR